jgi:hypothetical protein
METAEFIPKNTKDEPGKKLPQLESFFQPKLAVSSPDDEYEQEADRMADHVMRMPMNDPPFFKPNPVSISRLQRKCKSCEDEEKVQRKENSANESTAGPSVEDYIGSLNNSGTSLDHSARVFFEPRFSSDFSNVTIHTDAVAAKSAQSINALAYTTGNHIVFNEGQYSPGTESGKRLLAHELTHVIQQKSMNNHE